MKKLGAFLEKVDDSPSALHLVVKQRRSSLEAEANQANKAEKDEVDSEVKMVHL